MKCLFSENVCLGATAKLHAQKIEHLICIQIIISSDILQEINICIDYAHTIGLAYISN